MEFLQNPEGQLSSGRLMKLAAFVIAAGLAVYGAVAGANTLAYVAAFLAVATAAEAVQKATGQ